MSASRGEQEPVRLPSASPGAYSDAVVSAGHCYVAGQLPVDWSTGTVIGTSVEEQTTVVLERVLAVLSRAGFHPSELVTVTVLLADAALWARFDATYRKLIEPHGLPARMAFTVPELHYGALVEVQAVAVAQAGGP